jgi:hypothetical protein
MDNADAPRHQPPFGQLERTIIDEFLRRRGYDPEHLSALPDAERDAVLKEASIYASAKLAEVESRSHLLDELHGSPPGTHKADVE